MFSEITIKVRPGLGMFVCSIDPHFLPDCELITLRKMSDEKSLKVAIGLTETAAIKRRKPDTRYQIPAGTFSR